MIATVSRFFTEGGFGYLQHANYPRGVFVHVCDCANAHTDPSGRRELHVGDVLEFSVISTQKGPRATRAVLIEAAEQSGSE